MYANETAYGRVGGYRRTYSHADVSATHPKPSTYSFWQGEAAPKGNKYSRKPVERKIAVSLNMYDTGSLLADDCRASVIFLEK